MLGIKPTAKLQMIAVSDIGKYAPRILSQATGRSVQFVQTPIEKVRKWSSDFATMLEWFDRATKLHEWAARESVWRPVSEPATTHLCEHPVSLVD